MANCQLSINHNIASAQSRARLYHFRALPPDLNKILIDFYPKDIKEIAAAGGSWGVFIAAQEPLARRSQIIQ